MNTPDLRSFSGESFFRLLDSPDRPQHDPFKLRQWIDRHFPELQPKDKLWLSQSLFLSNRLSEKHFPYSFWWITQSLFEMATDFRIATFHARILSEMTTSVTDMTAGSGFDLLAFSQSGLTVKAHETDVDTATLLERNLSLYNHLNCSVSRENGFNPLKPAPDFWFADPMRRSGHGRTVQLESYSPRFSEILFLKSKSAGGLVKISPMTNLADPALKDFCKIIVSLENECREVLLLHGKTKVKDGSLWIDGKLVDPESHFTSPAETNRELRSFIYDPDPAVMKSGQLTFWAEKCGLHLPAADSGFPQGSNLSVEHLFKPFFLIESLAYKVSDIPALFKKYFPRRIVLKKKNSSLKIEEVEKELGKQTGRSDPPVYFFITSEKSKTVVYVGEPLPKTH